jgi:hypothetical protein
MYSSADIAVTPRPQCPADGCKLPDVHTHPPELRDELQSTLGTFPPFRFWGPAADITCSAWIARAACAPREGGRSGLTIASPHDRDGGRTAQRQRGQPRAICGNGGAS